MPDDGTIARPGHRPEEVHLSEWVRRLTPEECAVLQGFPPSFRWIDRKPRKDGRPRRTLMYSMIGNAVPPQFGRAIATAILEAELGHG